MIKNYKINHFRMFRCRNYGLFSNKLQRINLITGDHDSGKTTLLEAIRLWAAKGDPTVVNHLVDSWGQFVPGRMESYDALFNRPSLVAQEIGEDLCLEINELTVKRHLSELGKPIYEVLWDGVPVSAGLNPLALVQFPNDIAVFVPAGNDRAFPLARLWNDIVLTPAEDDVVDIVRHTILPDLVRLYISQERILLLLKSEEAPLPLQNFGTAVKRVLSLAVALISAKNNILLIDEIESGLNQSIQEELWDRIIFYANTLDIQVFATGLSEEVKNPLSNALKRPKRRITMASWSI